MPRRRARGPCTRHPRQHRARGPDRHAHGPRRERRAPGPLPFGRQGSAWDIANAACFLLSDEAAYINAAELPVDGGLRHGIARAPGASA
ncbi:SDR family oxidoreductase [Variovorax paradoxus]|uniref:SDR family oxidoreductase n=1 Tax=Variovorax paradoxus TaxID=34073 RepID=UPI001ABC412C